MTVIKGQLNVKWSYNEREIELSYRSVSATSCKSKDQGDDVLSSDATSSLCSHLTD